MLNLICDVVHVLDCVNSPLGVLGLCLVFSLWLLAKKKGGGGGFLGGGGCFLKVGWLWRNFQFFLFFSRFLCFYLVLCLWCLLFFFFINNEKKKRGGGGGFWWRRGCCLNVGCVCRNFPLYSCVSPLWCVVHVFCASHSTSRVLATMDHGFFITHNRTLYLMPHTIPAEWVSN